MKQRLFDIFSALKPPNILVVGDVILDRYVIGDIERISPESPAQVLDVTEESETLGGAGNVAANVVALGGRVNVVGVVGKDRAGQSLRKLLRKRKIGANGLVTDETRPTTTKTRFAALRQQMLRVDRESSKAVSDKICAQMLNRIEELIDTADGIIVSDYAKGVLADKFLAGLFSLARKRKKKVIVDPKGADYSRYKGAFMITPNKKEASMASGVEIKTDEDYTTAAKRIFDVAKTKRLVITRGEEGITLFNSPSVRVDFPAEPLEIFDVSGAGDTVIATIGIACFAGVELKEAVALANISAGAGVRHVGAWAVTRKELLAKLGAKSPGEEKIMTLEEVAGYALQTKATGAKVVFTNGCFDLLHAGHVKLLQQAKSFGDILVVGLNSDHSIRRLKGSKRPLLGEDDRLHILSALDCVDAVALFYEDTPIRLIKAIKPHILVKGGDYKPKDVVGGDIVVKRGGKVMIVELVNGKSTSGIIEKIIRKQK